MSSSPLIVIGMHRSGTSLIAEKLTCSGVFLGSDLSRHSESLFFLRLNQMIFRFAHAHWDTPQAMKWLLQDQSLCEAVAEELLKHWDAGCFLGDKQLEPYQAPDEVISIWGWKDPRNIFTLPLWMRLFPHARVLNIVRNGVDVAHSLMVRETRRKLRLDSPARSSRCLTMERSFQLWTEYVEMAANLCAGLDNSRVFQINYESFLEHPADCLSLILNFAGINPDKSKLEALCQDVDTKRRYAFVDDSELKHFYQKISSHPMMAHHHYQCIG